MQEEGKGGRQEGVIKEGRKMGSGAGGQSKRTVSLRGQAERRLTRGGRKKDKERRTEQRAVLKQ